MFLPNRMLTRCKWMYNDIKKLVPVVGYFLYSLALCLTHALIFLPSEYYYTEIVYSNSCTPAVVLTKSINS